MSSPRVRKAVSFVMTALCGTAVLFALIPLAFILFFAVSRACSRSRWTSSRTCRPPLASEAAAWPTRSQARSW